MKCKNIIRISIFVLIFTLLYSVAVSVLELKDDMHYTQWFDFYRLKKNSIDVLFVGDSHVYTAIVPPILWNDYGIRAYDLAGGGLRIWLAYFHIIEALKYQSPKLIAIEAYGVNYQYQYSDRDIQNSWKMKFSMNKIQTIIAAFRKDIRLPIILKLPIYHKRHYQLKKEDFKPLFTLFKNNKKNIVTNGYFKDSRIYVRNKRKKAGIKNEIYYENIPKESLFYYMKIIVLAKKHNIELLFFITPYSNITDKQQGIYNSIEKIAKDNNIKFINYNLLYDEINLDFEEDFFDASHLNIYGASKVTKDIGKRIALWYGLKDNRDNPEYSKWNIWADDIIEKVNNKYDFSKQYK
ncbi:MAG: hypothetical protein LBT79_05630 [Elusimicrobiota bacterium]|jgi:hypothetical protein|nr:hypothetical protein [Elusimicrobiota bacterium]